jgi:hypothetical protein
VIKSGDSGYFKFGRLVFANVSVCSKRVTCVHRHTHWFRVLQHPKLESSESSESPQIMFDMSAGYYPVVFGSFLECF